MAIKQRVQNKLFIDLMKNKRLDFKSLAKKVNKQLGYRRKSKLTEENIEKMAHREFVPSRVVAEAVVSILDTTIEQLFQIDDNYVEV